MVEQNAIIESLELGIEEQTGFLKAWIYLKLDDGSRKSFGKFFSDDNKLFLFISKVLFTVGVDEWEEMKGLKIKVTNDDMEVYQISNINNYHWFNPKEFFKKYENA